MAKQLSPRKALSAMPAPMSPVTPEALDQMRYGIFALVEEQIPAARQVLNGTKEWSGVQLRLFQTLLAKVVPEVTYSRKDINVHRSVDELSYEELMAIAAQAKSVETGEAIDVTPEKSNE